jgi:hypothetical protein
MRMGTLELSGGIALLSWGCFYGPDWPPSISNGNIHISGTGGSTAEGGTLTDAGDSGVTSFDAASGFACDQTTVTGTCTIYTGLADPTPTEQSCVSGLGNVLPSCIATGCVGCCKQSGGNGVVETCYYQGSTAATVQTNCQTAGGTFSATP